VIDNKTNKIQKNGASKTLALKKDKHKNKKKPNKKQLLLGFFKFQKE
jgi:hypothetical protein